MKNEQLDSPLATRKNFRRNDKFRQKHPIKEPIVDVHSDAYITIDFENLYPRDVFLGTDEPVLTRKIISIANRHGFHVKAKAVHFVIRSWMDDFKSGDEDPDHGIWVGSICGHNPLYFAIQKHAVMKHGRYAV